MIRTRQKTTSNNFVIPTADDLNWESGAVNAATIYNGSVLSSDEWEQVKKDNPTIVDDLKAIGGFVFTFDKVSSNLEMVHGYVVGDKAEETIMPLKRNACSALELGLTRDVEVLETTVREDGTIGGSATFTMTSWDDVKEQTLLANDIILNSLGEQK